MASASTCTGGAPLAPPPPAAAHATLCPGQPMNAHFRLQKAVARQLLQRSGVGARQDAHGSGADGCAMASRPAPRKKPTRNVNAGGREKGRASGGDERWNAEVQECAYIRSPFLEKCERLNFCSKCCEYFARLQLLLSPLCAALAAYQSTRFKYQCQRRPPTRPYP
jgi:hypothetical protein